MFERFDINDYQQKINEILGRLPWYLVVLNHTEEGCCSCGDCLLPWSAVVSCQLRGNASRLRRADKKLEADLSFGSGFLSAKMMPDLITTNGVIFGYSCRLSLDDAVVRLEQYGWHKIQIADRELPVMECAAAMASERQFVNQVFGSQN